MQVTSVTITVLGEFHDVGTVDGEADVGDAMEYAVRVVNPGSVTVTGVGECSLIHCILHPDKVFRSIQRVIYIYSLYGLDENQMVV